MWRKQFFGLALILLNCGCVIPDLPIKKCKKYDSPCILVSTQRLLPIFADGIPDYKVKTTDPLWIGSFSSNKDGMNFSVKNGTITGVKTCEVKKMEMTSTRLSGEMICDITVTGQYQMDGRLMMMTIQSAGDMSIVMRRVLFSVETDIAEVTKKDGEKHWRIKNYKYTFDIQGKASMHLGNIQNPVMSQVINQMLKDTPKDLITEMGNPVVADVVKTIASSINNFFRKKQIKQLVLP